MSAFKVSCLLALVLVGTALPSFGQAQTGTASHVKQGKVDLPNFHMVHSYLYRGGEPSQRGLSELATKGIKTIIDLRAPGKLTEAEKLSAEKSSMNYINLPMSDKAPTKEQIDTLLATVKEAKAKEAPAFVHCAHGSDRTGCMIGIWRVCEDGYSYSKAYKEMLHYYFGPQYKKLSQAVKTRAKS